VLTINEQTSGTTANDDVTNDENVDYRHRHNNDFWHRIKHAKNQNTLFTRETNIG